MYSRRANSPIVLTCAALKAAAGQGCAYPIFPPALIFCQLFVQTFAIVRCLTCLLLSSSLDPLCQPNSSAPSSNMYVHVLACRLYVWNCSFVCLELTCRLVYCLLECCLFLKTSTWLNYVSRDEDEQVVQSFVDL